MINIYIKAESQRMAQLVDYLAKLTLDLHIEKQILKYDTSIVIGDGILFYEIKTKEDIQMLKQNQIQNEESDIVLMKGQDIEIPDEVKALCMLNTAALENGLMHQKELLSKTMIIKESSFQYNSGFMNFQINPEHVLYIESYHHDLYIHTGLMKLRIRDSLKNYIINNKYLKLIQVHKSFVVNLAYIQEIQSNCIILKNDEKIMLGERYKAGLNSVLKEIMA